MEKKNLTKLTLIGVGIGLAIIILASVLGTISTKKYENLRAQIEREEIEKQKQDSIEKVQKEIQRIADSITFVEKRAELAKEYGKTFTTIENKIKSNDKLCYTITHLQNYCEWSKKYGLQVILDDIDSDGLRNSNNEKNISKRAEYQKKYGRNRANNIIAACHTKFLSEVDWGDVEVIGKHRVSLGFTERQCELAWGRPERINRTTNNWSTHEQWCYSNYNYLYFDDGVLTTIQN